MNEFEYGGIRWGVTFLKTACGLSTDDVHDLMVLATVMYLDGEDERDVKTDAYEGRICTKGEYGLVGEFGGRIYHADIETEKRRELMSFLVNERTGGGGVFSKN